MNREAWHAAVPGIAKSRTWLSDWTEPNHANVKPAIILKRPWCWERLKAGGEGNNREWDGWMASPTQWTWVWVNSRSWWRTGRPGMLRFMGSQRVGHSWVTELNQMKPRIFKLMSIESVMPSNHLILCHPLLLPHSIFPSIRVFSNESALCIRWPKYWSFSFNISPSNEHPGLISFRTDWLDPLEVQGTLKSLLQHHNSKASILRCSAFFIVQLSHPYMTTGKTIALTRWTFVGKVMSLLFNMLFKFNDYLQTSPYLR